MLGVSSCLAGFQCRYDGGSNTVTKIEKLYHEGRALAICPEVLGGLPTPRTPAEIVGGDGFDVWQGTAKVMTKSGEDVTAEFMQGAKLAYEQIKELQIDQLILKAKSPSCGCGLIYDGTFSGNKVQGVGVATAYFKNQGLTVLSDEEWLAANEKGICRGGLLSGD